MGVGAIVDLALTLTAERAGHPAEPDGARDLESCAPEPEVFPAHFAADPQFSGMNQLRGQVVSIRFAGLVAEVVLAMGEHKMTAIIPADAANELQLKQGDVVSALFNQTSVMVGRFGDR